MGTEEASCDGAGSAEGTAVTSGWATGTGAGTAAAMGTETVSAVTAWRLSTKTNAATITIGAAQPKSNNLVRLAPCGWCARENDFSSGGIIDAFAARRAAER